MDPFGGSRVTTLLCITVMHTCEEWLPDQLYVHIYIVLRAFFVTRFRASHVTTQKKQRTYILFFRSPISRIHEVHRSVKLTRAMKSLTKKKLDSNVNTR
jgi:hypothetical protein